MKTTQTILVGGFTPEQRQEQSLRLKNKYEKKGYEFVEFVENGKLSSFITFNVDPKVVKREKLINWAVLIAIVILSTNFYFILSKEKNVMIDNPTVIPSQPIINK